MRPLTEEVQSCAPGPCLHRPSTLLVFRLSQEIKTVLEKLYKYIGKNIKSIVERRDEPHCFRLHSNRVYYVRESLMRRATNVSIVANLIAAKSHSGMSRQWQNWCAGGTRAASFPWSVYWQTHPFWQISAYYWSTRCACCPCKV